MVKESWISYAIAWFVGFIVSYLYCVDENKNR